MLIKLNLPSSFVSALKVIYRTNTGKAALEAYVSSPVSITVTEGNRTFLEHCEKLSELIALSDPTDSEIEARERMRSDYLDCVVHAAQLVRAFDAEKELQS